VSDLKTISPQDYLRTLDPATIARACQGSYNSVSDLHAAKLLEDHARLAGYFVQISPAALGRYRSTIGLVSHRSPRGAQPVTPQAQENTDSQLALPADDLRLRSVVAQEQAAKALWAIREVLNRQVAATLALGSSSEFWLAGKTEESPVTAVASEGPPV
jgi:hypothetical protein